MLLFQVLSEKRNLLDNFSSWFWQKNANWHRFYCTRISFTLQSRFLLVIVLYFLQSMKMMLGSWIDQQLDDWGFKEARWSRFRFRYGRRQLGLSFEKSASNYYVWFSKSLKTFLFGRGLYLFRLLVLRAEAWLHKFWSRCFPFEK